MAATKVLHRVRQSVADYPRGFWILSGATLIGFSGIHMIWPLMSLYARQQFDVPVATVSFVFTLFFITSAVTNTVAGAVVDRFGRKGSIVLGQAATCIIMLGMSLAGTLVPWAILMVVWAVFWPLYIVANNAMVADLFEPERRAGAYALLLVATSVGSIIGTSSGGFITSMSYTPTFYIAAGTTATFALLIALFVPRTAPREEMITDQSETSGGYGRILRDWPFLAFCVGCTLISVCCALEFLLPIYGKENLGVPESQYGLIMSANSVMALLLQYTATRRSERLPRLSVLAGGVLVYALGVGSVAWGWNSWTLLISKIIMTAGMLVVWPISTAIAADFAPTDMRGRYLGAHSLARTIGTSVGSTIWGFVNDEIAPIAVWYGGLATGMTAVLVFILLTRVLRNRRRDQEYGLGAQKVKA